MTKSIITSAFAAIVLGACASPVPVTDKHPDINRGPGDTEEMADWNATEEDEGEHAEDEDIHVSIKNQKLEQTLFHAR